MTSITDFLSGSVTKIYYSFHFILLLTLIIYPGNYIYSQSGWTSTNAGNANLNDVTGSNGHLVTVGDNGAVYYSSNNGSSWASGQNTAIENFNSVFGVNPSSSGWGYLIGVGDGGWFIKSTDNGATWNSGYTGNSDNLYGVFGFGNNIWAVGKNSAVMYSTDAGQTWTKQETPYQVEDLYGIYFSDQQYGHIVGTNGLHYWTFNGGSSWHYSDLYDNYHYNDIFYFDNNNGWIVGNGGGIKNTKNGLVWGNQTSGVTTDLTGVASKDENTAWAVGKQGKVVKTTDGGSTWQTESVPSSENFNDVYVTPLNEVWVVGHNGVIVSRAAQQYRLTRIVTPDEAVLDNCHITANPDKEFYNEGESVDIEAVAGFDWKFFGWQNLPNPQNPNQTIIMNSDKTVTAEFEPVSGPYTLTLSVSPAEAANNGAAAVKNPDKPEYNLGEVVAISAVDGSNGWAFKEWTGGINSTNRNDNITMGGNQTATANFVQPVLTVSGSGPVRKVLCPEEAHNSEILIMSVQLSANDVDDWSCTSLKFKNLISKKSISEVRLKTAAGKVNGTINPDTTQFTFNLNPAIVIPKSSSVTVSLYFFVSLPTDDQICEMNELREYRTVINQPADVTAEPMNFDSGLLIVPAPLNSYRTFIACVENSSYWGFNTIQEAIDSELSGDVDVQSVCMGEYHENIKINRSHTIKAKSDSAELTVLYYDTNSPDSSVVELQSDNAALEGFTVEAPDNDEVSCINSLNAKNLTVKNNILVNGNSGIEFNNVSGGSSILNNKFIQSAQKHNGIKLIKSSGFSVSNNTIENCEHGIYIRESTKNKIDTGIIKNTTNPIYITKSDSNTIKNISVEGCTSSTELIKLEAGSTENEFNNIIDVNQLSKIIVRNESERFPNKNRFLSLKFHTLLLFHSQENYFSDNELSRIVLNKSFKDKFISNRISFSPIDGIYISFSDDNEFRDNIIKWNMRNGIWIESSSDNIFDGNTVLGNKESGVRIVGTVWQGNYSQRNEFYRNKVYNNYERGIIGTLALFTKIMFNTIYDNSGAGIQLGEDDPKSKCLHNEICYNTIRNNEIGIVHKESPYTTYLHNEIHNNKIKGIYISSYSNPGPIEVKYNKISGHDNSSGIGIDIDVASYCKIIGNTLWNNCTGIKTFLARESVIKNNKVKDNQCSSTGIHLTDTEADIEGNDITGNAGAGIMFENSFNGKVSGNNIYDNPDYDASSDISTTLDLSNNYWGNSGPNAQMISGNIDYSDWLADPVSLIISIDEDTSFAVQGTLDSTSILIMNFQPGNDQIEVSFSDDQSWLTSYDPVIVEVDDTTSAEVVLYYNVPSEAAEIFNNKVSIAAKSVANSSYTAIDSFYIVNYVPALNSIDVEPDSITISYSDSLRFSAEGIDQYGYTINDEMEIEWQTSGGEIDSLNYFRPDSVDEVVQITATDLITGIEGYAYINVRASSNALEYIEVEPDSVWLKPGSDAQFRAKGYSSGNFYVYFEPAWFAGGGEIDSAGLFTAGDEEGIFTVTAEDTVTGITGTATVFVGTPQLAEIIVSPDSTTVEAGETLQFEAEGYNQFGFPHLIQVEWSSDGGAIDANGLFTADSISETCTITAEDILTGIKGTATVFVEGVVLVEEEEIIPEEYNLFQNYPNPFNPTTVIKFGLPVTSMVKLEVYNILGERVALLVNEIRDAGYHQVSWNTAGLSSGIYIYTIYTKAENGNSNGSFGKDFRDIKKMVLLK